MKKLIIAVLLGVLSATALPVAAQTELDLQRDKFLSGPSPVHDVNGTDDLFMSGETVKSTHPISGSAHLVGRNIMLDGAVAGDLYSAGMDITINAPIDGDATLAGYSVSIGDVGGDLRIVAKTVTLSGEVTGYTAVRGERVKFESQVKGDVHLTARDVEFSESAQIEGTLTVFERRVGEIEIPESVVAADRVERRPASQAETAAEDLQIWDRDHPVMEFIIRLLLVGIIVGAIAALMPNVSAKVQQTSFHRPFSTLWLGFLALSAAIGSAIVLLMTGVAFILVPVSLLVAFVGGLAGYFIGVYLVGVGVLKLLGRAPSEQVSTRVLAACSGALATTLISRIPVLGWVGTLTILLIGLGGIAVLLFRPKFFVAAGA